MSDIETQSGVNGEGQPFVTLRWDAMRGQLTVAAARAFALTVLETAEAAEFDACWWAWMGENLPHLPTEERAKILAALREYRERLREDGERER